MSNSQQVHCFSVQIATCHKCQTVDKMKTVAPALHPITVTDMHNVYFQMCTAFVLTLRGEAQFNKFCQFCYSYGLHV